MKKALVIISIVIAIICIVFANKKPVEAPTVPVQTEEVKKEQPKVVQPKAEPKEEQVLFDENDMPKSDVDVPEIG